MRGALLIPRRCPPLASLRPRLGDSPSPPRSSSGRSRACPRPFTTQAIPKAPTRPDARLPAVPSSPSPHRPSRSIEARPEADARCPSSPTPTWHVERHAKRRPRASWTDSRSRAMRAPRWTTPSSAASRSPPVAKEARSTSIYARASCRPWPCFVAPLPSSSRTSVVNRSSSGIWTSIIRPRRRTPRAANDNRSTVLTIDTLPAPVGKANAVPPPRARRRTTLHRWAPSPEPASASFSDPHSVQAPGSFMASKNAT